MLIFFSSNSILLSFAWTCRHARRKKLFRVFQSIIVKQNLSVIRCCFCLAPSVLADKDTRVRMRTNADIVTHKINFVRKRNYAFITKTEKKNNSYRYFSTNYN